MKIRSNHCLLVVLPISLWMLSCNLISTFQRDSSVSETGTAFRLTREQSTPGASPMGTITQTLTLQPSATSQPPTSTASRSPTPSPTAGTPLPLVLDIQTSVDTFYCYDKPSELTITVRVSDINRGMAVQYHIRDKNSGVSSDEQILELRPASEDTRSVTIIGGLSEEQNLQFPPLMRESYFLYQIVSDDGNYHSPVYSDVTFFPCAQ